MNLLQRILDKLGFKPAAPAKAAPRAPSGGAIPTGAIARPKPVAIPVVDVVGKLEGLVAKNPRSPMERSRLWTCSSYWIS